MLIMCAYYTDQYLLVASIHNLCYFPDDNLVSKHLFLTHVLFTLFIFKLELTLIHVCTTYMFCLEFLSIFNLELTH